MFVCIVFVIHNYTEEVIDDKPLLETLEEVETQEEFVFNTM